MPDWLVSLLGWVPAIVFPVASAWQLWTLSRAKNSEGTSSLTWATFAVANVACYGYVEKYLEPQAISMVVTAVFQIGITVISLHKRKATA